MRLTTFVAALALIMGIGGTAMAQDHKMNHQGMDSASMQKRMDEMMPAPNDAASTREFKELHMKMMMGMHLNYSGNADVDFARSMIPHHQGAIDMAKIELKHGKNPAMRKMAEKIIKDQEKEIAQLQAWLKENAK